MTSNVGAKLISQKQKAFGFAAGAKELEQNEKEIKDAVMGCLLYTSLLEPYNGGEKLYYRGERIKSRTRRLIPTLLTVSYTHLFVMELPAYHWPTLKNVRRSRWERGWSFIKKAGTDVYKRQRWG